MYWLILVFITNLFDSSRIYADNYISDVYFKGRGAVSQKVFYGYAFVVVAIILATAIGFNFSGTSLPSLLLVFAAGAMSSLAGIPYYRALELDDSTNLGIFIQLAPVLYLVLGWLFLGETISPLQLLSFFIILSAPLLIFISARKRSRHTKLKAIALAFLYVAISVISNLIFVRQNTTTELNFIAEMSLIFLGKGIGNLLIITIMPNWRHRFHTIVKFSRKKVFRPMCLSLTFSLIKDFTYRATLILAPTVALASAVSDSSEPVVIFFMGILLTLISPKFGRESLTKKSVFIHLIATTLVVAGIILLQL